MTDSFLKKLHEAEKRDNIKKSLKIKKIIVKELQHKFYKVNLVHVM